jgi:hypothetical protein
MTHHRTRQTSMHGGQGKDFDPFWHPMEMIVDANSGANNAALLGLEAWGYLLIQLRGFQDTRPFGRPWTVEGSWQELSRPR